MSYILDALKKAEAERRQEQVPGLHTQPLPVTPSAHRRPAWLQPAAVGGALTALAVLAVLAWWQPWSAPPPVRQASPVPIPPAATVAQAAPPAPPPARPETTAPAAAEAPPAEAPAKAVKPKAKAEAPKKARLMEQKPESKPEPKPEPKPETAPPEESIVALRDLPEAVQRTIPPISVGGYIYAAKPAARSVLINKRLVREGDQVAPDLVLERMTPNGMVFNFRGTRFRTSY